MFVKRQCLACQKEKTPLPHSPTHSPTHNPPPPQPRTHTATNITTLSILLLRSCYIPRENEFVIYVVAMKLGKNFSIFSNVLMYIIISNSRVKHVRVCLPKYFITIPNVVKFEINPV